MRQSSEYGVRVVGATGLVCIAGPIGLVGIVKGIFELLHFPFELRGVRPFPISAALLVYADSLEILSLSAKLRGVDGEETNSRARLGWRWHRCCDGDL